MDTSGTSIVLGVIKPVGKAHGALNCMVWLYAAPDQWVFRQFISEEDMAKFAAENGLAVQRQEEE